MKLFKLIYNIFKLLKYIDINIKDNYINIIIANNIIINNKENCIIVNDKCKIEKSLLSSVNPSINNLNECIYELKNNKDIYQIIKNYAIKEMCMAFLIPKNNISTVYIKYNSIHHQCIIYESFYDTVFKFYIKENNFINNFILIDIDTYLCYKIDNINKLIDINIIKLAIASNKFKIFKYLNNELIELTDNRLNYYNKKLKEL